MANLKIPAFGKPLMQRRKQGERIGLVVIGVHDWDAGQDLAARSGTARLVVDVADLPHELDWSCVVALDCLLVGECDPRVFYATATMVFAAGAASIWGMFDSGILCLERWFSPCCPEGFYTYGDPVQPAKFGAALALSRSVALMYGAGVYGTPMFDQARTAEYERVFGAKAQQAQEFVAKQRAMNLARAA